ncbi:MAG: hypothetical protein M1833_006164 [Piccolia ochrophora]|nr:MAG: hypothetical protein M1833_006164 [Piccolia ochrophora]
MENSPRVQLVRSLEGAANAQAPTINSRKERSEAPALKLGSYVASLESRIEKLEKRLAKARSQHNSGTSNAEQLVSPSIEQEENGHVSSLPKAPRSRAAKRREASDVDSLVSDFGFLAVNATARDYYGFTSSMSFARLVLAGSTVSQVDPASKKPLPLRHLAMPLVQHYLDHIFVLYPFFSETSLFGSVDAMYQNGGRNASDWDYWAVHCVLAIASASVSRKKGDLHHQNASGYIAAALSRAEAVLHPGSITGVQAILFLVQFSTMHTLFDSWYLIGMASRTMLDLGIHQDPVKENQTDRVRLGMRRRVFYTVYSLDREISMAHGRSFSFPDESINVTLPSVPNDATGLGSDSQPQLWLQPLDPAMHLWRMRILQATWYHELYLSDDIFYDDPAPHAWAFCHTMREHFESLPKGTPARISQLLEMDLLYSYIYILSPSRKFHIVCDIGKSLTFEFCVSYAAKVARVIDDPTNATFLTFLAALRAYFVGQQLLNVLRNNYDLLLAPVVPVWFAPFPECPRPIVHPHPNGRTDNAERATLCIERTINVLTTFGHRWDAAASMRDDFVRESSGVLATLRAKSAPRPSRTEDTRQSATATATDAAVAGTVAFEDEDVFLAKLRQEEADVAAALRQEWDSLGGDLPLPVPAAAQWPILPETTRA